MATGRFLLFRFLRKQKPLALRMQVGDSGITDRFVQTFFLSFRMPKQKSVNENSDDMNGGRVFLDRRGGLEDNHCDKPS